jgi:chloramphenicol-sensitive protein RarD
VTEKQRREQRGGLFYGLAAYGLWGLMPLYFLAVDRAGPLEILAHRIVWCLLLLVVLLTIYRGWPDLARCLRSRKTVLLLLAGGVLIAFNWFIYIYGVSSRRVVENSLGYFINPLFSVLLGVLFFRERPRVGQWAALALAAAGMAYLVVRVGTVPWVALGLAGSFGLYGLARKVAPVDALAGLFVETAVLAPAAAGCLIYWHATGEAAVDRFGWGFFGLLVLGGPATALPLLCFGRAARRLPLSTLGFLQYLAPSLQFLLAVSLLGEPFRPEQQVSFGCIWIALAIYSAESVIVQRMRARERERFAVKMEEPATTPGLPEPNLTPGLSSPRPRSVRTPPCRTEGSR